MKRLLVLAAAATAIFAAHAQAPAFPGSKPVTFVVPFAAGGPTDRVARDLAEAMRKSMGGGANFVVENVNGAGGTIGAAKVARATPTATPCCCTTSAWPQRLACTASCLTRCWTISSSWA
jgi:tripartite-type tricarboxylate transporter receptor subunit TctC